MRGVLGLEVSEHFFFLLDPVSGAN